MEGLFRSASSIRKTRSHMSSIKSKQRPSEDIILPSELAKTSFKDPFISSGPSFLEKRELEEIFFHALNGNLPIRELVDEEDIDRSVVIRLEETLTEIRRIHDSTKIIRNYNRVDEEEEEDEEEFDYL